MQKRTYRSEMKVEVQGKPNQASQPTKKTTHTHTQKKGKKTEFTYFLQSGSDTRSKILQDLICPRQLRYVITFILGS